ncbi:MAG: hypothetical protein J6K42_00985 [Clostridia bacterium]|nr:hypothetical protein [Clostridia bacterium]
MKKTVIKWIFIIICGVILVIDFVGFWKYKVKGTKYEIATNADATNDAVNDADIEENIEPEIEYEELTSKDFSDGEKLFITNINKDENEEDKYIIKGLVYEEYEFSKEEYNNLKSGKNTVEIFGNDYSKDKISSNNLILKSSDSNAEKFYIKYDTKTKKYILKESTTDSTIYKSTEKYVQTTVDNNIDFVIEKNGKKNTSKIEEQKESHKNIKIPTDAIKIDLCELTFNKKGICTKITKTELN